MKRFKIKPEAPRSALNLLIQPKKNLRSVERTGIPETPRWCYRCYAYCRRNQIFSQRFHRMLSARLWPPRRSSTRAPTCSAGTRRRACGTRGPARRWAAARRRLGARTTRAGRFRAVCSAPRATSGPTHRYGRQPEGDNLLHIIRVK